MDVQYIDTIVKYQRSIFIAIIRNFNIIYTSKLIQSKKYCDPDDIISNLNKYDKKTGIMIGCTEITANINIYSIIFDRKIIIFDDIFKPKLYPLINQYLSSNEDAQKLIFYDLISKQKFKSMNLTLAQNDIINENDKYLNSKIAIFLFNLIIRKSQYRTLNRRYDENSIQTPKIFNFDDFILLKSFNQAVNLCFNSKDQFLYVLKKFNICDLRAKRQIEHEINFYERINNKHNYFSKFYGQFQNQKNKYIVIEYIEGRTLFETIKDENNKLSEFDKIQIILQIMISIEFIHFKSMILRDLKYDNIIVDSKRNAILTDFNCSSNINDDLTTGDIGSLFFVAP